MLAVTTFHPQGYRKYGKRCLEGLSKHFPGKIVAFHEEETGDEIPKVEFRDWHSIKDADRYIARIKSVPNADGLLYGAYDFRYNCNSFCRKVFAQDAVFDESEYVFWIDADTIVLQDIPESFLKELFKGTALVFLGRNTYTETGFVGFHTKHPDFPKFRANYLPYFTTGRIFGQLKGWHDCIAFDHARQGVPGRNLSPHGMNYDAVMTTSVLSRYFDHLKGNRKLAHAA